jgi:tetratricopeptide (TPR) repeat protein
MNGVAAMGQPDAHNYLQVLKKAEAELKGPRPEAWFDRLEKEHDQLQGALQWFFDHEDLQRAMELTVLVWRFWMNRGHIDEGRKWLGVVLPVVETTETAALRAEVLFAAGTLAFQQGDQEAARTSFEQSLSISRRLNDAQGIVRALTGLARVALRNGDYPGVRSRAEEALETARELSDRSALIGPVHLLAAVTRMEKDYPGARALYEKSIELRESLGDERGVAMEVINLGSVEFLAENFDEAARYYVDGLKKAHALRNTYLLPGPLIGLGAIAATRGEGGRAATLLAKGEALVEATGGVLDPDDQPLFDQGVSMARAATDEQTFTAAWAEGRAMPLEQVIEYALRGEQR